MAGDRGGDVKGTTKIDMEGAVGEAVTVAEASFDPGYPLGHSLEGDNFGYMNEACLKQGYCSYGVAIGSGHPGGMVGGKGK